MFHYIAIAWNCADLAQRHTAKSLLKHWKAGSGKWQEALSEDGLYVLYAGERTDNTEVHRLDAHSGVVLGTLFKSGNALDGTLAAPLRGLLDQPASARIMSTHGRELVDAYWGSYVAILRDAAADTTRVIRSPVGFLPCLSTSLGGVQLYFSSMADCASCELLTFTINWGYVARHLGKMRQSSDTGLNEVSEVRSGECVEINGNSGATRKLQYWDPLEIARSGILRDPEQAAAAVRNTTRMCVHAWAACHEHILHRLSGGLDSSIVLSCLQDAPSRPQVFGVNRYSPRSDSDEREFARLAAQQFGCELVELNRNPEFRLDDIFQARLAERPQNYITQFGQILPEARLAHSRGASAIFDGTYGDQLFYAYHYALTVADYVHDFGIRPGLLPVVLSAAQASKLSMWKILRESLAKGLVQHRWDPISAARAFNPMMNEDVLRGFMGTAASPYPWYRPDRYVPPGKQIQISAVMAPTTYSMPFAEADDLQYVSPLLSQPLVELCLRIPSYVLSHNGWDREIERRAFSSDIPARIARRRTKGGQADFSAEVKNRNYARVREVLMNGWLVESRLIDRDRLEEAFAGRSSGLDMGPARMSRVLNIEVWLKTWADRKWSAAA
jgi:asparagine synthase (glutamine-hydrolysing)